MFKAYALVVAVVGSVLLLTPPVTALPAVGSDDGSTVGAGTPEDNESAAGPDTETASGAPQRSKQKAAASYGAEDWTVAIYPVLAWAPIFGASINLPDLPDLPSHPIQPPTGATFSTGLNGAAFFGGSFQNKRFVMDLSVLWASIGVSASSPSAFLDAGFLFYDFDAGVKVHKDLAFTAGVRHLGMTLDAQIGDRPQAEWKPGITDPMLGISYRHSLSKKWGVDIAVKGGGFGAGSDVDFSSTGRMDWRFAKHFGASFGYGVLHFKITSQVTIGSATFTRETKQTLNGPILGFGIFF